MKKELLSRKILIKFLYSLFMLMLYINMGWGQTTVFHETFGTAAVASGYTGGTSTVPSAITYTIDNSSSSTGVMKSEVLAGGILYNVNSVTSTNAKIYYATPFSSSLGTNLSSNTGKITWTVNLRTTRATAMSTGLGDANQYGGVVLCSTGSIIGSASTATGYAVLMTRSTLTTTANTIKLVKMTVGFGSTSTSTLTPTLIESVASTNFTNYRSVKVTYDPTTGIWELLTRDDGTTAFADPTVATSYVSAGTSTDAAYTATTMSSYGFFSNTTSGSQGTQSDNFKIVLDPPANSPAITSTVSSLSGFTYNQGSGPSAGQPFTVAGTNLSSSLIVTPSTNYEISDDGGVTYNSSVRTYTPNSGTVTNKTIYARLKAGLTANAYNETITVASTGANVLSGGGVACSGNVTGFIYYYYNGIGSLTATDSWGFNPDGSGSGPINFTSDNQQFFIRNTTAVTTSAAWIVSGTNSKIILGDSSVPAVALTVASGFPITGIIDIPAANSGSNNIILQDAVQPSFGTLNVSSEVHYNAAITTPNFTTSTVFGKVIIDAPIGQVSWVGNPVIQANGSLTVVSGSTLFISGSSSYYTTIYSGASVVINGTVRIQKIAGFVNNNVTPGTSYGSFQFTGAENLTLGVNSIIEYNKGSNASTYNITARSYPNLTISGLENPKAFLGATTVTGILTLNQTGTSTLTGASNITLASGATIVRTAGNLDATPIFGSKVNVTYNGATAISSGFEIPSDASVLNNLTINNVGGVTLSSATSVNNKLTLTSGTLATAGFLTLKSNPSKTAYVGVVTGSISGNVNVERYIPAGQRAYRFLSSPVTTSTFINTNWQAGTHITGAGGATNGFDATTGNNASMFTYNNATPAWNALTNTNATVLTSGVPYLTYIRGSRSASLAIAPVGSIPSDATTLSATGILTTGNVLVNGLNETADGFSAIGNPYQAQVDMQTVLAAGTNLNTGFYYVVDPSLGTKGAYLTVDVTVPASAHISQYLQPGQACFVKTLAAGPASLTFTEANKSEVAAQTTIFKIKNTAMPSIGLTLYDAADIRLDVLKIAFDASEINDVNQNDASKMTNFDETMASSNNGKLLSIEKRAMPTDADEIPLNITKYRGTSYSIKAEGTGLTGSTPYLLDQFANKTTEIPQDGSVNYAYSVDVAIPASIAADRFKLIYAKTLKSIDNEIANFALYPNPSKTNSFTIAVPQSLIKPSLKVSNMLGQQLYSQSDLQSGANVKVTAKNVKTTGVYLVSLTSEGKTTTTTKWIVE
ncbi:MAG: T9SS type A sorting domain-containing protein [Flavobacterium sp.]|nr:T9SS type A sorting domain-containing protein [Flavobacterium sp.]